MKNIFSEFYEETKGLKIFETWIEITNDKNVNYRTKNFKIFQKFDIMLHIIPCGKNMENVEMFHVINEKPSIKHNGKYKLLTKNEIFKKYGLKF